MNAFYLMLSTFVLGVSGFAFWAIVTRTYDTTAVGLATTLLSVSSLLSLLGLVGFDTTFVRFLPRSNRKNDYINSGFIVTILASFGLAISLAIILPMILPGLAVLGDPLVFISFVFFTIVTALNVLTNAIFLAYKQARYILIINASFSAVKIILPFLALGHSAGSIFAIAGLAQLFGLVLSIIWMQRKFGYKMSPILHVDTLRVVRDFSASIYVSNTLSLLPPTILPLIILYHIDAKNAAYYYMAFTIANVLYTIVYGSMQSVLAEGSHDETALRSHIVTAAKLITALLLPATLVILVFGDSVLTIFGAEYATKASPLLQLLAIGALPIAAYSALSTIFKISKKLLPIICMNAASALIVLGLSNWWISSFGLVAVGWAWIIGNVVACCIGVLFLIKNKRRGEL
jgi:O-antigen/teichoic acid export membrane protein